MTKVATSSNSKTGQENASGGSARPIIIIGVLFFIFGFVTWLNAILIPYFKISLELNNFQSYLVAFAFYISYFVMSIPSAWVLKVTGFKKGMSVGLLVMAAGALLFVPAALTRTLELFLIGLFVQGTGLALLQTASNPYITILGPLESAAKRISIMGVSNKIGGILGSIILGAIVLSNADEVVAKLELMSAAEKAVELNAMASKVIMPYLIITGALVALAIVIYFSSLPEVDTDQEDETVAAANVNKTSILQFPHLLLGAFTMFLYVGVEVMAGDTIVSYGAAQDISFKTAKFFTSFTLGAMVVAYFVGVATIPKYIRQDKALQISAILGVVFTVAAIMTSGIVSVTFIALLGLANALMWPAIFPLAIADLGRFTKIGSSLIIMGIAGGAILPLIYGALADKINPQQAYWIMVPCYLFILYYAMAGHKIRTK
ncbi:sugar MFS transporter [Pontibacter ramchanderi]|uniref:Glucose/galactose transporter n=1 Tax=Pontibacter ramchanderi TaxID=1179743 RepID=A0A2N3U9R0_9BACT|nr:sugar MFS transporter [Pontibacter ramchanderi]PKV63482.1 glucose/galactose transporter [Pontibacter ramchanderi]